MKDSLKKILVLGAGPVVIGQSSEFDYTGTQICRTLKKNNIETVVLNSNPATVMTDKHYADKVYMEPMQAEVIKKILSIEKPDGVLISAAGKENIELCLEMNQTGDFADLNVSILDVQPSVYESFSNRRAFHKLLQENQLPFLQEEIVSSLEDAIAFASHVGFPVSLKAAFSMDSKKYVTCLSSDELQKTYEKTVAASPLGQVLIQKCITGYKEIDIQCVRDASGDFQTIISTEYMEAIGIHSGDSIAVLPAQTISDSLLQKLYIAAKRIADAVSLCGTCFIRFAISPDNQEYLVFGADASFSRNTALAEKASHYPLSVLHTELALGYTLNEIQTKNGFVLPDEQYLHHNCFVRIPKWSFENFGENAYRKLGDNMKSVGEVFACGDDLAHAFYKAVLSLKPKKAVHEWISTLDNQALLDSLHGADDLRVFLLLEALHRQIELQEIQRRTNIDLVFLNKLQKVASFTTTAKHTLSKFDTYNAVNQASENVLVIGAGPTSIGLGADRDFATTLCLKTLRDFGKHTIALNTNPSANSTSTFAADVVYIEPIQDDVVEQIIQEQNPKGAILAFGGGHAIRRSTVLKENGVQIYGPDLEMHNTLKNKLAFIDLLDSLQIRHVDFRKELVGRGAHVDILSDGQDILIPGICEHIEKAKVHSGDSLALYPSLSFEDSVKDEIVTFAKKLCVALKLKGLLNMQFVVYNHEVYVISASVVATRNIPFMTKATGLPIMEFATRLMLGETLSDLGVGTGLYKEPGLKFVRVPVFSFEHLDKIDVQLGNEMKSTGEVIGIGSTYDEAIYKGFLASGMRLKRTGGVMISVADSDKPASVPLGESFLRLGFKIYATANTAKLLNVNHIAANSVRKIHEGEPNTLDLIVKNKLSYLVSTAAEASSPNSDDVTIRRTALLRRIPVLPSVEMAQALTNCLEKNTGLEEITVHKL